MGTFHQNKHELHGITVVVETGDGVYVGRCDDIDERAVILLDADAYGAGAGAGAGDEGRSREEWVRRAAQYGVWPKHRRIELPRGEVTSVQRLGEVEIG